MIKVNLHFNENTEAFKALELVNRSTCLRVSRKLIIAVEYELFATKSPHKGAWINLRIDKRGGAIHLYGDKTESVTFKNINIHVSGNEINIYVENEHESLERLKRMLEVVHNECVEFVRR